MKKLRNIWVISIIMLILISATAFADDVDSKTLNLGDTITDFDITAVVTLKKATKWTKMSFDRDIKGKSKLAAMIFTKLDCPPCATEMEFLAKLSKDYDDLKLYAFEIDIYGYKAIPPTNAFLNKNNLSYWFLDRDFKLFYDFDFIFVPSLVIIDEAGKIVYKKSGFLPGEDEAAITKVVKDAL